MRERFTRQKRELATIKQSEWVINLKDVQDTRTAKTRAFQSRAGSRDASYDRDLEQMFERHKVNIFRMKSKEALPNPDVDKLHRD